MRTSKAILVFMGFGLLSGFTQCAGAPQPGQGVCYFPGDPNQYNLPNVPFFSITAKSFELCYNDCGEALLSYVTEQPGDFTITCQCRDGSSFKESAQNDSPDSRADQYSPLEGE